jgi:hypothetical protein
MSASKEHVVRLLLPRLHPRPLLTFRLCKRPNHMRSLTVPIGIGWIFGIILSAATLVAGQSSRVENNTFISSQDPDIRVEVNRQLKYVGSVPFRIDNIAGGNRYIFVRATPDKHIQQMFIIQQEAFFPSSNDTYKYSITHPSKLGDFEYQHTVILDDYNATVREAPGKEADLTQQFLKAQGYILEPETIMSRFARPVGSQHKHEIIFFCHENLSGYGHKLADFVEGTDTPEKQSIKNKVDENCRNTFHVNP